MKPETLDATVRGRAVNAHTLVAAIVASAIGSSLTTFALDVWIFERTHSYNAFALLLVLSSASTALLSPWAGRIVDVAGKGKVLILSELVSLGAILSLLVAFYFDLLNVGLAAVSVFLLAAAETFRAPAFYGTVSALVPRDQLGRINGIIESCRSGTVLAGPVLGVAALNSLGLQGIFLLDICSFVFSVVMMRPLWNHSALVAERSSGSPDTGSFREGLNWVVKNRPLRKLLLFLAATNCGFAILAAAQAPYILSFATPAVLSAYLSIYALGMLIGGCVFSRLKICDRGMLILTCLGLEAVALVCFGYARSAWALCACGFMVGCFGTMMTAANQTSWQEAVPLAVQGRVYCVRVILGSSIFPAAVLLSIPLAKLLFEPLVQSTGHEQGSWLSAWGTGTEGALGLMLSTVGIYILLVITQTLLTGGLRLGQASAQRTNAGRLT